MFIKKKQQRDCRYPSYERTSHPCRTFNPIDLNTLAHIPYFDERSFLGRHGVIHSLLIVYPGPVVRYRSVCVPTGILLSVNQTDKKVTWLTSGEESLTDRMLAVMISSLSQSDSMGASTQISPGKAERGTENRKPTEEDHMNTF